MLGKILDQGKVAVVYSPIVKTSNSGLFTNKRLAILSLQQSILGYLSKLPDDLATFQDANCARNCKERVNIRQQSNFAYYLSPDDHSTLILKWQQKMWEFKFQNAEISNQWYRYIFEILNPPIVASPQPKNQVSRESNEENANINFSKLTSISRFVLSQPHPNQEPKRSQVQLKQSRTEANKQMFISQEKGEQIDDKERQPEYRFKQFQREHNIALEAVIPAPNLITTFRERFPNNTIFSSVKKQSTSSESDFDCANNWNWIWYEAIQSEEEQVRISIYNGFLQACQDVCKEILAEVTMLKQYRKHVPVRISAHQEIYKSKSITFHLLIEKDIQNSGQQLCSDHLLNQYRKIQENYAFVLKATKNKGLVKVPLACLYQYRGFNFFCEGDIPSQFSQVDHSNIFIFYPQIQRLEEQLKIKLSLSHLDLFTNKLSSIIEPQIKRNHYLIIKDVKRLLPEATLEGSSSIILSKNFFLQSNNIYSKDYDFSQEKSKFIKNFLKEQNTKCTIISYEDLRESLEKTFLTYSSLSQLIPPCQNKYLSKVFITEHISQIFCRIVRTEMMIFVRKWNKDLEVMLTDETPGYEGYIFQLLSQFLSEHVGSNIRIWDIVSSEIYSRLKLSVKMEEIIIGYLLSSISLKLGINLDFQLLLLQKEHFFNEGILISPQTLKSFEPIFIKYANEEMCDSYEAMFNQLQNHEDQRTLTNVQRFYRLKQQNFQPHIEPFIWKKIRKLFSFYVPYDNQEEDYEYLSIYKCLNFLYLDYSNFGILVSAIKWLFHANRPNDALYLLHLFKEICWFWVSENNPFLLELYQIVSEYYRISGNLIQAVEYIERCNQFYSKLTKGDTELNNRERNRKLAQIYMSCNLHKQSLKKYLQVKKILRKADKQCLAILNVLVQISRLYLHLGDIENCSKTCKQTIEFSTFNPFQNEQQEYQIYSILLRSFQIQDDYSKYKLYVDIVQQKFKYTKHPIILQNLLRLIIEQILQKETKYHLKKFAFILYYFENKILETDEELSMMEIFRRLIKEIGIQQPCKILRYCIDNKLLISDSISQRQAEREEKEGETVSNVEYTQLEDVFQIICRFIGFEFILAHLTTNLNKK